MPNLSGHSWFNADYAGMIGDDVAVVLVRRAELRSLRLIEIVDLGTDPTTQQHRTIPLVEPVHRMRMDISIDATTTPTLDDLRKWMEPSHATPREPDGTD